MKRIDFEEDYGIGQSEFARFWMEYNVLDIELDNGQDIMSFRLDKTKTKQLIEFLKDNFLDNE